MRCKEAAEATTSASSSYYYSSANNSKRGREEEEDGGNNEQQLRGLLGEAIKALEAAEFACGDEFDKLVFANSTLSREEAFMENHFPTGDHIAYLNVGGQPIATHTATLRAFEESMLGTLFGKEEWIVQAKDLDDDGNYCLLDHIDFATFQKVSQVKQRALPASVTYLSEDACQLISSSLCPFFVHAVYLRHRSLKSCVSVNCTVSKNLTFPSRTGKRHCYPAFLSTYFQGIARRLLRYG